MSKKQPKIKSIVRKYITTSVAFHIDTPVGDTNNGAQVTLIGTFMPETKTVVLDRLEQISGHQLTLEKVLSLAVALTELVSTITHKEHLRELAEGFGESIEAHKKKVGKL